ncbi:MAG: aldo/keto reductase [Treponemataceae bacterium]|nr:MAG: aldo/keto reductase [Treponemataceae bacterium]
MQYRIDKKSGEKLSILGLGCMRFPKKRGKIDMEIAESVIMRAIDAGVNYFDTAYIYAGSEEALGEVLHKNNVREKIFIATKLPLIFCHSAADFDKLFEKQLSRLKTDYVDYYLMHMLTDRKLWQKLCDWGIREWLDAKKKSGAIKHVGFSFHGIKDEFLGLLDEYDWEFCQIQYNYANENYQAGTAGYEKAAQKNIPIIIMEPLLGGKLATALPKGAAALFTQKNAELGVNYSSAAWAFRWLWDKEHITVVLSGMSAVEQLEENLITADSPLPLTAAEKPVYAQVLDAFNKSYKIPCTGCSYCMPCPKNVNIPACFSAYNTSFAIGMGAGRQQYMTSSGITSAQSTRARQCVGCGKCETHCPQNIAIRQELKRVCKRLDPWWFNIGVGIARAFIGSAQKQKST